jgi:hypothetical protein
VTGREGDGTRTARATSGDAATVTDGSGVTTDDDAGDAGDDGTTTRTGDATAGANDRGVVDRLRLATGGVGLAALFVGLLFGPPLHAPGDGLLGRVGLGAFADDANALGLVGGLVLLLAALLRGRIGADAGRTDD